MTAPIVSKIRLLYSWLWKGRFWVGRSVEDPSGDSVVSERGVDRTRETVSTTYDAPGDPPSPGSASAAISPALANPSPSTAMYRFSQSTREIRVPPTGRSPTRWPR